MEKARVVGYDAHGETSSRSPGLDLSLSIHNNKHMAIELGYLFYGNYSSQWNIDRLNPRVSTVGQSIFGSMDGFRLGFSAQHNLNEQVAAHLRLGLLKLRITETLEIWGMRDEGVYEENFRAGGYYAQTELEFKVDEMFSILTGLSLHDISIDRSEYNKHSIAQLNLRLRSRF